MYDYFYWDRLFSKKEIKDLNSLLKKYENKSFSDDPAKDDNDKSTKNVSNVKCVHWVNAKSNLKYLYDNIKICNKENYGFNIFEKFDTDSVLYNTYEKNDDYGWHKDGSNNSNFDVKFTIIINNSEHNYSGGDFELFTYGGAMKVPELNNVGTAIMFKSDIVHRVLPIKKGKRNSMVFFIEGDKFK
tara:strand:+ start:436 stop:993 length:558 start_codon:yes stop_codon:yes gene_type:complete